MPSGGPNANIGPSSGASSSPSPSSLPQAGPSTPSAPSSPGSPPSNSSPAGPGGPGNRRLLQQQEGRQSLKEQLAVNFTLSMMHLEINVFQQKGAKRIAIQPTQTLTNLSDYLQVNSYGLQEINLDL